MNEADLIKQLRKLDDVAPDNDRFKSNLKKRLLNSYGRSVEDFDYDVENSPKKSIFLPFMRFGLTGFIGIFLMVFCLVGVTAFYKKDNLSKDDSQNFLAVEKVAVDFDIKPDGSKVYIAGELAGISPFEISLEKGNYDLLVQKEGYEDYISSIFVDAKEEIMVKVELVQEVVVAREDPTKGDFLEYEDKEIGLTFDYDKNWELDEKSDEIISINSYDFSAVVKLRSVEPIPEGFQQLEKFEDLAEIWVKYDENEQISDILYLLPHGDSQNLVTVDFELENTLDAQSDTFLQIKTFLRSFTLNN